MSDATLRTAPSSKTTPAYWRGSYADDGWENLHIPARKASLAVNVRYRVYSDDDAYAGIYDLKNMLRQHAQSDAKAEALRATLDERTTYPWFFVWLGWIVFLLIGGGVVAPIVAHLPIAALGVPLGFTLWTLLAYLIRKVDQRRQDA